MLLEAIEQAKEEILISTYAFNSDRVGKPFIAALCDAARRGVRVRVLFDYFGSRDDAQNISEKLSAAGISVRAFRPISKWILKHPLALMCRDHARVFLIDRTLFGLGGMGFADIYRERSDIFMLHRVLSAAAVVSFFENLWQLDSRVSLSKPLRDASNPALSFDYALLASGPLKRDQDIYRWLIEACSTAQKHIRIITPFFFPDRRLLGEFADALARGVQVTIITPIRTDKPRYDRFRAVAAPQLASRGATWYTTHYFFHAKIFTVDTHWAFGSANFDIISTQRNYELSICGTGGAILRQLQNIADGFMRDGVRMNAISTPLFIKILGSIFYRTTEFFFKLT